MIDGLSVEVPKEYLYENVPGSNPNIEYAFVSSGNSVTTFLIISEEVSTSGVLMTLKQLSPYMGNEQISNMELGECAEVEIDNTEASEFQLTTTIEGKHADGKLLLFNKYKRTYCILSFWQGRGKDDVEKILNSVSIIKPKKEKPPITDRLKQYVESMNLNMPIQVDEITVYSSIELDSDALINNYQIDTDLDVDDYDIDIVYKEVKQLYLNEIIDLNSSLLDDWFDIGKSIRYNLYLRNGKLLATVDLSKKDIDQAKLDFGRDNGGSY